MKNLLKNSIWKIFIIGYIFFISIKIAPAQEFEVSIILTNPTYNFIIINAGSKNGIKEDEEFRVLKDDVEIGKVKTINVHPEVSACGIVSIVEGRQMEKGDRIRLVSLKVKEEKEVKKKEVEKGEIPKEVEKEAEELAEKYLLEEKFKELEKEAEKIAEEVKEEKKGKLVSFSFKDADIQNVLRIFSKEAGLNIIAPEEVKGKVTVSFTNVNVEDALTAILQTAGYTYQEKANIIKIIPLSEAEIKTTYKLYKPNYGQAGIIKTILEEANIISDEDDENGGVGKIIVDERSNTLMIIDTPSNIEKIDKFLAELDIRPRQVVIEAKIIDVNLSEKEDLGIDWTWISQEAITDTTERGKRMGFSGGQAFFKYGTLSETEFAFVLEALKTREGANILSKPTITTLDHESASIAVTQKVAYQSGTQQVTTDSTTTTTVQWEEKEVGVTLTVTPHIGEKDYIIMDVAPEASLLQGWTPGDNPYPMIMTRKAETQVIIKDGDTLVIGGLISKEKRKTITGVPILSNIPILGVLFRKTVGDIVNSELLIFITPHIVKEREKEEKG